MSRYVKRISHDEELAWGFDHAVGYYMQLFDSRKQSEENDEGIVFDKDQMFSKMSNSEFLELLKKYNCPDTHIQCVAMDLPF